jgi:hypothetical protein
MRTPMAPAKEASAGDKHACSHRRNDHRFHCAARSSRRWSAAHHHVHHTITTLLLAIGLGCGTPLLAGDSGVTDTEILIGSSSVELAILDSAGQLRY